MSLPIPLSVRLVTSRQDRIVTRDLADVQFRSVIPGGFASCTIRLNRPLRVTPDEVALYGRLVVYDTRSGVIVWDGRIEDPGRTVGPDGEVYEIAAVGGSAHARDRTVVLVYNDRRLDENAWQKAYGTSGEIVNATVAAGENPTFSDDEGLLLQFPTSQNVVLNSCDTAVYKLLEYAGQNLAMMNYRWDAGNTDASWRVRAYSSGSNLWRDQASTTAGSSTDAGFLGVDWSLGDRRPVLKLQWTGGAAATGSTGVQWVVYVDLVVVATRYLKTGVERTDANVPYQLADADGVLASEVFEDLCGRLLTQFDGTNATVEASTVRIEQFAYPDGATAERILQDALGYEPSYYWTAWERTRETNKHRVEFRKWPTVVGVEANITDGYDAPGSAADLYSHVLVRYRDKQGRIRHESGSQTVAELTNAYGGSLIRQGFDDRGDEGGGTLTNAQNVVDTFLDEHRFAPNAGQLTVAKPIMDVQTGRYIMPWEAPLRVPGRLVRVRGIDPRVDALNPTDRDGVTVFRCTGAEFSASSGAATLDLESSAFAGRSQARAQGRMLSQMAAKVAARRR